MAYHTPIPPTPECLGEQGSVIPCRKPAAVIVYNRYNERIGPRCLVHGNKLVERLNHQEEVDDRRDGLQS